MQPASPRLAAGLLQLTDTCMQHLGVGSWGASNQRVFGSTLGISSAELCSLCFMAACRHTCRGPVSAVLAILAAAWSAVTAAKILSKISHALAEVQTLVMMPCFLLYGSFALLTVY